jgi:hypothetical protein
MASGDDPFPVIYAHDEVAVALARMDAPVFLARNAALDVLTLPNRQRTQPRAHPSLTLKYMAHVSYIPSTSGRAHHRLVYILAPGTHHRAVLIQPHSQVRER